ncbi:MAG: hypothetical protein AB1813_27785 [Verrucomicrobiota bacterium]
MARFLFASLLWAAADRACAKAGDVPPAEQLLPAETAVMLTVPDWQKLWAYFEASPQHQLWNDAALKAAKEKLLTRWQDEFVTPLEREMGITLSNYTALARGQISIGWVPLAAEGEGESLAAQRSGFVLVIDTKEKADQAARTLAEFRKKWIDAGKTLKSEKIREVEFTTLLVNRADINRTLRKLFPAPRNTPAAEPQELPGPREITFGLSGSLLVLGDHLKAIEKVLARQSGAPVPSLAEQASFAQVAGPRMREALVFGWMNFKPVYESLLRKPAPPEDEASPAANPLGEIRTEKVLAAAGLAGLKSIAFQVAGDPEGWRGELFIAVPETDRQGLFKILTPEPREGSPPPFVAADTLKFNRWRLSGAKAFSTIETVLHSISPGLSSVMQYAFSVAGQSQGPDFNLKQILTDNLGDDFITVQKSISAAAAASAEEGNAPASLLLMGSPNPEKLVQAFKALMQLSPMAHEGASLAEREFLGRKLYSMPDPAGGNGVHFVATAGYAALSTDDKLVEEFLRSTEASAKPLRELPGLAEAAQKVGGMGLGIFGYENQKETVRAEYERMKTNQAESRGLLSNLPVPLNTGAIPSQANLARQWIDPELLPPFDQIAKYFHFSIYSGSSNAEGLTFKIFFPNPPLAK